MIPGSCFWGIWRRRKIKPRGSAAKYKLDVKLPDVWIKQHLNFASASYKDTNGPLIPLMFPTVPFVTSRRPCRMKLRMKMGLFYPSDDSNPWKPRGQTPSLSCKQLSSSDITCSFQLIRRGSSVPWSWENAPVQVTILQYRCIQNVHYLNGQVTIELTWWVNFWQVTFVQKPETSIQPVFSTAWPQYY